MIKTIFHCYTHAEIKGHRTPVHKMAAGSQENAISHSTFKGGKETICNLAFTKIPGETHEKACVPATHLSSIRSRRQSQWHQLLCMHDQRPEATVQPRFHAVLQSHIRANRWQRPYPPSPENAAPLQGMCTGGFQTPKIGHSWGRRGCPRKSLVGGTAALGVAETELPTFQSAQHASQVFLEPCMATPGTMYSSVARQSSTTFGQQRAKRRLGQRQLRALGL
jgi:hypothetical protein